MGTHSSAVGRGLVSHHTRTSGFDGAGLGHGSGFGLHFSAGAVGFEFGGELRSIGLVSLGTKGGESSDSGDGEETGSVVNGETPVKFKKLGTMCLEYAVGDVVDSTG